VEWAIENGMKMNSSKSKAIDLRELELKFRSVTLLMTKKFRKRAFVNIGINLMNRFKLGGTSKLHNAKAWKALHFVLRVLKKNIGI
jgi:hypothetical protein